MAKRSSRPGRSRKRRGSASAARNAQGAHGTAAVEERGLTGDAEAPDSGRADERPRAGGRRARRPREQPRASTGRVGGVTDALAVGERPHAPWHPFPLSELLILAGAIGAVVAWQRGVTHGGTSLLIVSIVAVMLGTIEVTLREHLSGYRSHALLLSVLPPVALYTGTILIVQSQTTVPPWLKLALLPVAGLLLSFLYRLLRARFADARRERVFAASRR